MPSIILLAGAIIAAASASLTPTLWPLAVVLAFLSVWLITPWSRNRRRAPRSELLAWQSRMARQHRAYLKALAAYRRQPKHRR